MGGDLYGAFSINYETALSQISSAGLIIRDALGGVILIIIVLAILRAILRGALSSLFGPATAKFGGGLIEVGVVILLVAQNITEPAVTFAALGWSAAIFKSITTPWA